MDGFKKKEYRRDLIDSYLTMVNKDLMFCKLFYFFFFAAFGSLYPLLAIYFKQLGMNPTQSGILIGFRPFIEFCSAPFWGGVADRWRKWRLLQLLSIVSWIVFTLAMAFVKPPHVMCFGENNTTDIDIINYEKDLIKPAYSTVYYDRGGVQDAFFALLLIIVIGEFFSAPAITFADTVCLSYLGEDTDNYGKQRMFGSLGWGLSMFFVGIALDGSTTFPGHPCETQHEREKDYIVCFAVFSVLMSCAAITAFQFKFPIKDEPFRNWPPWLISAKNKVVGAVTGNAKIDREKLEEEDVDIEFNKSREDLTRHDSTDIQKAKLVGENGKPLQISLQSKNDMVSDVVNSPGAVPYMGSEEPFLGRWTCVLKQLAQMKFIAVLFVVWFMGFGIGLIFTFLFWHLQDLGGSPTLFGVASVMNHMSELLAYFMCSGFIAKFGHIKVLYAGLVGNIVRFIYISLLTSPWLVLPFELVQGLTHAAVWATTCSYVMQAIPLQLRSSAQGILQGLHHGLGRGCGAVFGGLMVYQYGAKATFCAYGVTCIFVLIAFVGVNVYLKRHGVEMESHEPHESLKDDQQMTFDPHGVPSGLVRDLSSSKLKHQDEQVASYGSTLGSELKSSDGVQNPVSDVTKTADEADDVNPRASEYGYDSISQSRDIKTQQRVVTGSDPFSRDQPSEQSGQQQQQPRGGNSKRSRDRDETRESRDPYGQPASRDETRESRDPYGQPASRDVTRDTRDPYAQPASRDETDVGRSEPRRRTSQETGRRHSLEHSETQRPERKERRRRQSGDIEGLREREDRERESRHYGDDSRGSSRRHGDDSRHGGRRQSKNRRSVDGEAFQDFDPNPREKIVFEQLPDFVQRSGQSRQQPRDQRESRDEDAYSRSSGQDPYRPF